MWKSPFFLFSTVIHKFAQTFLRNFIDAKNGKVYLPPQIEPEAQWTLRFSSEFAIS